MIQSLLPGTAVILAVAIFQGMFWYEKQKLIRQHQKREAEISFEKLFAQVKEELYQETKRYLDYKEHSEEYERAKSRCLHLQTALKQCGYGYRADKIYVVEIIKDIIRQYLPGREAIYEIVPYCREDQLSMEDMFDILLYRYEQQYQDKALEEFIDRYHLDAAKHIIEGGETPSYIITAEEIKNIYAQEAIGLSEEEERVLLAHKIYRYYKGFGVVDRLREMAVDGISGGVSGKINEEVSNEFKQKLEFWSRPEEEEPKEKSARNYDSVWIFFRGKPIHLAFLSFQSEKELRRVCQNIYRYNKAGQLSENIGYKVNDMRDGSRVVVVRPPFSESWAFFVRKFHIKQLEITQLFYGHQADILAEWLKYLVKGGRIMAITGSQGSGKTTLLMALIKHIYGTLTLRIQEMAFELHLRKVYPMRNILTFRETEFISGQAGLDLQKKTDGAVNILGEVATDEVAALMLQTAQVASLFTLFTHHAKTTADLILSLRNSLLKCNIFRDETIAEEQVTGVIQFDIHLGKDYDGNRYVERITEIIPESTGYRLQDIMVYHDHGYELKNLPSTKNISAMYRHMTTEDQQQFKDFLAGCRHLLV
ncbi:pilus assembly protein CpaF [Clostridiales bacterium COT073_COT-073]|nr:pilus assembly protein CpaF [Clostridiales bacterium COT073_COT-073]